MYTIRFHCPLCDTQILGQRWADEIAGATMIVETLVRCPGGHYEFHESYGHASERVGDQSWDWRYTESAEELAAREEKTHAAIRTWRATNSGEVIAEGETR